MARSVVQLLFQFKKWNRSSVFTEIVTQIKTQSNKYEMIEWTIFMVSFLIP